MSDSSKETLKKAVETALRAVKAPDGSSIVDAGLVSALVIDADKAGIILDFGDTAPANMETLRTAAEKAALSVDGIAAANAIVTASRKPAAASTPAMAAKAPPTPVEIPGVKHIIAVASGKGGVDNRGFDQIGAAGRLRVGTEIPKPEGIFPRFDLPEEDES